MKKLIALICVLLMTVGFVGCGQKEDIVNKTDKSSAEEKSNVEIKEDKKEDVKANKEEGKQNNTTTDENKKVPSSDPAKTPNAVEGNKGVYLEKIKQVQAGITKDLATYYAGITLEQNYAASEEYTRWDNLLNEIYGVLKEQMSPNDFKKLEADEVKWVNEKDPKAKESAKKYEGGTQYEVEYAMTLGQLTKERCNYLVNNYMK